MRNTITRPDRSEAVNNEVPTLFALAVIIFTQAVSSSAQANDLSGTCVVNMKTVPCTVSTDPYTVNVTEKEGDESRHRLKSETRK